MNQHQILTILNDNLDVEISEVRALYVSERELGRDILMTVYGAQLAALLRMKNAISITVKQIGATDDA